MQNWKTTAFGWGAGAAYILYKVLSGQHLDAQDFMLALGLAGVGTAAKDASTHSTILETQQATADDNAKRLRNAG